MLTRLATILITSTTLLTLTPQAFAGANDHGNQPPPPPAQGTLILNGQVSFGVQSSIINTNAYNVNGDVSVQGQAAGNAVDITTFDDTTVHNSQDDESRDISSTVNANATNIGGSVSISGGATCNSASVSTDPALTSVVSNQYCNALDPSSAVNAVVHNVGGDVSIASSAVGNAYEEDTNATSAPLTLRQTNMSSTFSVNNATINGVNGSAVVTSSAVGNNAQIVHYSNTP